MTGLYELVDAVVGERRDQPRQVTLVLRNRVALPQLANLVVLRGRDIPPDQFANVRQTASQNARNRSLNSFPSRCALCAAGNTARSASRRLWRTSQTARNASPARARAESGAGHQSPWISKTRSPLRARSSNGISASQGGRSVIEERAASSSSPSSEVDPAGKPNPRRNLARYSAGSSVDAAAAAMLRMSSSTGSTPRATPNAGGSISVSERTASGRRAAARSET